MGLHHSLWAVPVAGPTRPLPPPTQGMVLPRLHHATRGTPVPRLCRLGLLILLHRPIPLLAVQHSPALVMLPHLQGELLVSHEGLAATKE